LTGIHASPHFVSPDYEREKYSNYWVILELHPKMSGYAAIASVVEIAAKTDVQHGLFSPNYRQSLKTLRYQFIIHNQNPTDSIH
jgi:hypothetical protein